MNLQEPNQCPHSEGVGIHATDKERSLFKWQGSWVWVTVIMKPSHRGNISSPRKTSLPGPGEITVIKPVKKFSSLPLTPKLYILL